MVKTRRMRKKMKNKTRKNSKKMSKKPKRVGGKIHFEDHPEFKPNLSPRQIFKMGSDSILNDWCRCQFTRNLPCGTFIYIGWGFDLVNRFYNVERSRIDYN